MIAKNETIFTLPKGIQNIVQKIEILPSFSPSKIKSIIEEAHLSEKDLLPWKDDLHDDNEGYGRKLIYDGGFFEVMCMTWLPGDYSAIHDHGAAQWGAVQVFGPAEHATFQFVDEILVTQARNQVKAKTVLGVAHELIHQMGNPTQETFLSLHIYGNYELKGEITDNARCFDLNKNLMHLVKGGVFYHLPEHQISHTYTGIKANGSTQLRDIWEQRNRALVMQDEQLVHQLECKLKSPQLFKALDKELMELTDNEGFIQDNYRFNLFLDALKLTASFYNMSASQKDAFQNYARNYDELIAAPCWKWMSKYWHFFIQNFLNGNVDKSLFSIGCGTGYMEHHVSQNFNWDKDRIYGMDLSPGMIKIAQQRIHAEVGDVLNLDPNIKKWDVVFSGLNVFQYIDHDFLEKAIEGTASVCNEEGFFIGDFITPDHIRKYPNRIKSANDQILSVRRAKLIDKDDFIYQESEIFNLFNDGVNFQLSYEGKHQRFLPAINRVRLYFEKYFKSVKLYDAISLQEIQFIKDTCTSTRYLIIAQK